MPSKINCLLVDDDTDDQEIFHIALKELDRDINCRFAKDGIEGLKILNAVPAFLPDYIFLDLNMPRMNGIQCLTEIKKIDRLQGIPVFMYSTSSDPRFIHESLNLGAAEYLIKPASIRELSKMLEGILISKDT